MVETGQMSAVVQMTYRPADAALPHVEVLRFDDLRRMNHGATQRADFLVIAFVVAGTGAVVIDFTRHALRPGTVAWIAPGAVHRWEQVQRLQGWLVLCTPTAPLTAATRSAVVVPPGEPVIAPGADRWRRLLVGVEHLALEVRPDHPDADPEVHLALLTALVARIPSATPRGTSDGTFDRFRDRVEAHFRRHRDVGYYARALGYAERTLTRKVLAATGRTAKAFIDARVVLEAKRLLVHGGTSAAVVAAELGFADPSAFSVFFTRVVGLRPGAWLRTQATV
jgi:AraC-like DNA-binding protein